MNYLYRFIILLFSLIPALSQAQDYKRTWNWYFGDSAGVSFVTGNPVALTNGKMLAWEGCASISDTNGNLLFYTNGETVWNKSHQVMANGTGLLGYNSSTQEALIVPQPGNDSIYYVFTTTVFRYAIVNIKANGGLGVVLQKNIKLAGNICEKLAATKHQNGRDIWILVHGFFSRDFFAYLLTSDGLKDCPVISTGGALLTNQGTDYSAMQGSLKFSPDGKKLAATVWDINQPNIDLFDFNTLTGQLFNYTYIPNVKLTYSAEFSPNGRYLYTTNRLNYLYQHDISSWNPTSMKTSETQLYWPGSTFYIYQGAVQRASNGKLYVAPYDSNFISSIEYPDSPGTACGFVLKALLLNPNKSQAGLPNFVSNYFDPDTLLNFTYQFQCPAQQATFTAKNNKAAPQWTVSKKFSSGSWAYSGVSVTHTFTDTGTYTVKLKAGTDSISKTIVVGPNQLLYSHDTTVCQRDSLVLVANQNLSCHLWNDTLSMVQYITKASGTYHVTAWNTQGCKLSDSIKVRLYPTPPTPLQKPLPDSILFCKGTFVQLSPDSGKGFHWQDAYTKATRLVDTAGLFYTQWTDTNTCKRSDSTRLLYYPKTVPKNPLPDTVSFCKGSSAVLQSDTSNAFHWQDGYLQSKRTVDTAGLYIALWNDSNSCTVADSARVITFSVTKPTVQRKGDSLFASGNFVQWQWLFGGQAIGGAIQIKYKATQNGWFKVWGRDAGQCIAVSDSLNISNVSVPQIPKQSIAVYPNPVNSDLYIEYAEGMQYRLLNTMGQEIKQGMLESATEHIALGSLPPGFYLLLLQNENRPVHLYKLLKE